MMFALPCILNQSRIKYYTFNIPSTLWLDASVVSNFNLDSNSLITDWLDSSGNNFTATRVSSRVTYIPNSLNGNGIVKFNGIDNSLRLFGNTRLQNKTRYKQYTYFLVFKPEDLSNVDVILGSAAPATSTGQSVLYIENNNLILSTKVVNTQNLAFFIATDVANLVNTWIILVWSGSNLNTNEGIFMRINGGDNIYDPLLKNRFPFEYSTSNLTDSIWLGGPNNNYYKGDIAEFGIIPKALTLSSIQVLEGYLATKYVLQSNLPLSHPYRNTRPTDPSNIDGFYRDSNTIYLS